VPTWLQAQETKLEDAYILHYTYMSDFAADGSFTWGNKTNAAWYFDKREYQVGERVCFCGGGGGVGGVACAREGARGVRQHGLVCCR
jgi:hypothetical protein